MYLKHYNLTLKPFEISPDPKFLWLGEKHKEALAAMKYGILDNKGFISLTGDAGTGKTTLVNALANSLDDNVIFAHIADPVLEQLDFVNLTADAFKMNQKFSTKGDFLSHLKLFLNDAYDHNKEVVLLIEEAHRIDPERLEEVRLISNIERPDKKLLNIVFVGQNEFNSILKKNKALRQRIAIIHKLEPLQEIETQQYVTHRLKVAGSDKKIFSSEAVREIYSFSKGNPRLINSICDAALLAGYAKEKKIIGPEIIRECAPDYLRLKQPPEDLSPPSISIPETGTGLHHPPAENSYQIVAQNGQKKPAGGKRGYVAPIFVVILLSIFGYLYFFGENHAPYLNLKTYLGEAIERYTGLKTETSSQKPAETPIQQSNIVGAQVQALDIKSQNDSTENQLAQPKSQNQELRAALDELKGAKERVVELESEVAMIDTMLSQSQHKIARLTKELNQEKQGGELLNSELTSKVDLIAELQEKLEKSQANALAAETKNENSTNKINELEKNLLNLKTEKVSAETQLSRLRASYAGLSTDSQELKAAKERVAKLEGEVAIHAQAVAQSGQKVTDLTVALEQEKKGREQLNSELSAKTEQVARLEQKLEAALSSGTALEKDIEIRKNELADLQGQLTELKAQKASSDSRLSELESRNEALAADLEQLKGAKDRVAELEGEVAARDQTISSAEQRLAHLAKELDQKKESGGRLSSELSSKENLIAELQVKLANAQSNATEFEAEINNSTIKINELQAQLGELKTQQSRIGSSPVKEIAELQGQLLDLKAQKASVDTQLGQLKSRNEALTADLAELKGAQERIAVLEGDLAAKDQALSGSEEQLSQLVKELNQEKESKGRLNSELSSKTELIAELQEKLGYAQSNASEVETQIKNSSRTINELQEQLSNLKSEKALAETQLSELRSHNDELSADLKESKGVKERVDALESELAMREQTLSQSQQKVMDLTDTLEQEKKGREQLRDEVTTKADQVAELEQKLEAAITSRAKLEKDVEISKNKIAEFQQKLQASDANQKALEKTIDESEKEIAGLQNQLKGHRTQQTATEPSPGVVVDVPKKTATPSTAPKEQIESPNPSAIIDWVLKKKAK